MTYPLGIVFIAVPDCLMPQYTLRHSHGTHFTQLFNIVFVHSEDKQSVFYVLNNLCDCGTLKYISDDSLTHLKTGLGTAFLQPNQSFLINRLYMADIHTDKGILLNYPGGHPVIRVTQAFSDAFYKALSQPL